MAGTKQFVQWVADHLPRPTYVNIMSQYHVDYQAYDYPEIWRRITVEEYIQAMEWAGQHGLTNLGPDSVRTLNIYRQRKGG